jgi:hypothetical protein
MVGATREYSPDPGALDDIARFFLLGAINKSNSTSGYILPPEQQNIFLSTNCLEYIIRKYGEVGARVSRRGCVARLGRCTTQPIHKGTHGQVSRGFFVVNM